ncbi:hypothetical protein D3C75_781930 [compost metagenome]
MLGHIASAGSYFDLVYLGSFQTSRSGSAPHGRYTRGGALQWWYSSFSGCVLTFVGSAIPLPKSTGYFGEESGTVQLSMFGYRCLALRLIKSPTKASRAFHDDVCLISWSPWTHQQGSDSLCSMRSIGVADSVFWMRWSRRTCTTTVCAGMATKLMPYC